MISQTHLGIDNPLALFEISKARDSREKFKQDQLEALPSIADLAGAGKIELYTSIELFWEAFKNSKASHFDIGDLLAGSVVGDVPVPISRARRGNYDPLNKNDGDYLKQFVSRLLKPDYVERLLSKVEKNNLTEFEITNLNNIGILRDICKPIDFTHFGDAFHLWTASANQMDFFLTSDKKFTNVVTQNGSKTLCCQPIFPTELTELFNVKELKELPFEYGVKYFYSGMKYDE